MMQFEQRLTQTQRQQMVLTQKMQQALHILQLSTLELEQHIQQELEMNPFLEQTQAREEIPDAQAMASNTADDNTAFDESFDLDGYARSLKEGRDLSHNSDLFERQEYYQNSLTQDESLRAHLLSQLRIMVANDTDYAIGERIIIGDIDERGYFTGDCGEIAQELEVEAARVEAVLRVIQSMDPTGVGARDTVECLLLQIDAEYPDNELLRTLVEDHLEDLKRRQVPQIAKSMKISAEEVEELRKLLATLNPWPGHEYSSGPPLYVTPEVVVEKVDDDFLVRLATERLPELRINEDYRKRLQSQALSKDDKNFVRGKVESARWLQRNIEQRQNTILRVSQAIVDYQREFMEKGIEFIRPLTLQMIADQVGVHESTVARTTRGKYIQTPQGLFELKFFFSPGLKSDDGEDQSSRSVKALIQKIVDEENKRKPLSDQKIADLLLEQGIHCARRTVTKYREALDIPSTTMRREYG
ncbi:MAG: RNA polymerase factor sigma-54 [Candidatus Hydrogenedens sp.]|nr:RNA polymerase factor sigma-54 [Candidatus Hydrogenedens sp.]